MQMGSRPNGEPSENARRTGLPSETNPEGCPGRGKSTLDTRADLMTLADAGRSELLEAGISLDECYEPDTGAEGGAFDGADIAEEELERQYRAWRLALVRKRIVSGFY